MRLLTENVGELLLKELRRAVEAHVAVAFFSPDDDVMAALNAIPKLTVIVSEEFTINSPYKLEKLKKAIVRSIAPDADAGKLHAKVVIVKRANGSYWCLVGSANMTWQGLFRNQEACIVMESGDPGDEECVAEIRKWFVSLLKDSQSPDLEHAKLVFDARSLYQLAPRPAVKASKGQDYWALKTTAGATGEQHWPSFVAEGVIAIGWQEINVDPSKLSDSQLRAVIEKTYAGGEPNALARIRKFVNLKVDDIVLLCRGYNSTQAKPVHINGFARVTGPFRDDKGSKWWRYKHDAVIQAANVDLPRDVVASALGKESLTLTIHELDKPGFDRLAHELKKIGVHVEV